MSAPMLPPVPESAARLRVAIVDDEAPARRGLRRVLETDAGVTIVAECAAGDEAVAAIDATRPDAVFLDVQMPELDGFGVLLELTVSPLPLIVFVTAHDSHAPAAFDAAALDYLLKPVTAVRLRAALARVRERLRERSAVAEETRLRALLASRSAENETAAPRPDYLPVRLGTRIELVPIAQIDWLEADGDYVRVHTGPKSHLVSETLTALLERLDPAGFVRIHRARAVNAARIRALQRGPHGEYIVHLAHGEPLTAGRSFTAALNERFGANGLK